MRDPTEVHHIFKSSFKDIFYSLKFHTVYFGQIHLSPFSPEKGISSRYTSHVSAPSQLFAVIVSFSPSSPSSSSFCSLPFSTESSLYSLFTYGFGANPCNVVDLPGVTHLRKTDSAFPRISLVRCENSRSPPCTLPNCSLGFILCRSPAWNQSCCDHIGTVVLHLKPLLCLSPPSHWLSHLSSPSIFPESLCIAISVGRVGWWGWEGYGQSYLQLSLPQTFIVCTRNSYGFLH